MEYTAKVMDNDSAIDVTPMTTVENRDGVLRIIDEEILTKEEEHADELADLLFAVEPATGSDPQRLYFGDEVHGQSDTGEKVAQEDAHTMAGKQH